MSTFSATTFDWTYEALRPYMQVIVLVAFGEIAVALLIGVIFRGIEELQWRQTVREIRQKHEEWKRRHGSMK